MDKTSKCQQAYIADLAKARKLAMGLHEAIVSGSDEEIREWQLQTCAHFGVPVAEWAVSQVESRKDIKEFLSKEVWK